MHRCWAERPGKTAPEGAGREDGWLGESRSLNLDALRCLDPFNLCMTGNCVDDHLRHGVVIENTYGSIVSGNMIEECNGTAVILDRAESMLERTRSSA